MTFADQVRAIASLDRVMPPPAEIAHARRIEVVAIKTKPKRAKRIARTCTVDGVTYQSLHAAAQAFGLNCSKSAHERCASPEWPNWVAPGIAKRRPRSRRVLLDGVVYQNVKAAAEANGIDRRTLHKWLRDPKHERARYA